MSRSYRMEVEIVEFNEKKKRAIQTAAEGVWDFDMWEPGCNADAEVTISSGGEGNLCAGETEQHFVCKLSRAIWKANGGFCVVRVKAYYLDDQPYEEYELDELEYAAVMRGDDDEEDGA